MKLQKAGKALADADICIRLKPDWEKGHYRKAMVLEAMGELNQVDFGRHSWPIINPCAVCITEQLASMQALTNYEQAAKLQNTSEFRHKIATLKKQIQRGSAPVVKASPAESDSGKPASSFAFTNGRSTGLSTPTADKQESKVLAAPNVGEIRNDDDYAAAKEGMVCH